MTEVFRMPDPGTSIIVAFGEVGEQYAQVVKSGIKHNRIRVWRPSSKSWTKPRPFRAEDIVRLAGMADKLKFKPDFGLAWERY